MQVRCFALNAITAFIATKMGLLGRSGALSAVVALELSTGQRQGQKYSLGRGLFLIKLSFPPG
jgi:hypothetical protein